MSNSPLTIRPLSGRLRDISAGTYVDRVVLDYEGGVVRADCFKDSLAMFQEGWLLESTDWKYTPEHLYIYRATYVRIHG